jgi:hypothetical protein
LIASRIFPALWGLQMAQRNASYTTGVVAGTYVRPTTTLKNDGIVTAIADNTRVACILGNCVAIPSSGIGDISWGTKVYDPLSMSNVGNTAITVPLAGVYLVTFNMFLNENPFNRSRFISIYGAFQGAFGGSAELQPPGNNLWSVSYSGVIICVAGDRIAIRSGFACTVDPDAKSLFCVQRL